MFPKEEQLPGCLLFSHKEIIKRGVTFRMTTTFTYGCLSKSISIKNLPNAKTLKFFLNETLVSYWFYSIKYNQNNIACPSCADNLRIIENI
jgi:hypothetical protein